MKNRMKQIKLFLLMSVLLFLWFTIMPIAYVFHKKSWEKIFYKVGDRYYKIKYE
jgi:hypothetical protein